MKKLQIKILDARMQQYLPRYATTGSAGMDIYACMNDTIKLLPKQEAWIDTGLAIHIADSNYFGQLVPRSSAGIKKYLRLSNTVGIIDSDYQGELKIRVINFSQDKKIEIEPFERIAQLLIIPVERFDIQLVHEFENTTERGLGNIGSTGRF